MKILALNLSHHGSCAIIENGKIELFIEESRLSKIKYHQDINKILKTLKNNYFDYIAYTHSNLEGKESKIQNLILESLKKHEITYGQIIVFPFHHQTHAFSAFYNSDFEKAICLIVDNGGLNIYDNNINFGNEILSIIKIDKKIEDIFKICSNPNGETIKKDDKLFSLPTISLGGMYNFFLNAFDLKEPGAVMGLSCYGKEDKDNSLKPFFFKDNLFVSNPKFLNKTVEDKKEKLINYCFTLQKQTTEIILSYIDYIKNKFPDYPICLSGGVFQNCMINFEIIKKHKNIFVDPVCHDGGTSLGLAQHLYFLITNKKPLSYENIYLGLNYNYSNLVKHLLNNKSFDNLFFRKTSSEEVAELLSKNNVVALFQGRSESGPRALGNRSILFNPSNVHGKEIINLIKKRKWFRPYAGTVLDEFKNNWFNFFNKKNTEYMTYAIEVKNEKQNLIPAITHVDGTCRVQTLTEKHNKNFYNLIKNFYKITDIPILLNTSLNLAGKPLVEDIDDLVEILKETEIKYGYLPEYDLLIYK